MTLSAILLFTKSYYLQSYITKYLEIITSILRLRTNVLFTINLVYLANFVNFKQDYLITKLFIVFVTY